MISHKRSHQEMYGPYYHQQKPDSSHSDKRSKKGQGKKHDAEEESQSQESDHTDECHSKDLKSEKKAR